MKENEQLLMKIVNFVGGQDSLEADMEFRNSKKARLNMNWQNNEVNISFKVSIKVLFLINVCRFSSQLSAMTIK